MAIFFLDESMKSRFCPSPTGRMHLGNARTAAFNFLLAQHSENGLFLLRIEDSDAVRSEQRYVQDLFEDLLWLGLDWQEGPLRAGKETSYYQSQRHDIYDTYYEKLETSGVAYPCFCSDEQLALARKAQLASGKPPRYPGTCKHLSPSQIQEKLAQGLKPTLRFKVSEQGTVEFVDLVKGPQSFRCEDIGDFVIRRADGTASFMFCNAIDDSLMGVTHALRGEDHVTNTPRQLLILRALGLREPTYGHMALILGSDGSPLSKRNGSRSIADLREAGYLPIAILNYLARLGHHLPDPELYTLHELAQRFSIEALQKSPAKFDEKQLEFWQQQAVLKSSVEDLEHWLSGHLDNVPADSKIAFLKLIQPNMLFPKDALLWVQAFFSEHLDYSHDAKHILKNTNPDFFKIALESVQKTHLDYAALCGNLKERLGVKGKALFQPLRVTLTGEMFGPELADILQVMGEARVRERFENVLFLL